MTKNDYISREAFIADCEGRYCAPCKEQGKDVNGVRCRVCWVDDMLSEVLDAPAADVEPVRHGRWESVRNPTWKTQCHDKCPICGWENTRNAKCYDEGSRAWRSLYSCPNCGAKMDLEGDNGS